MNVSSETYFRLPAEWEAQSFVQLTWPHAATDWASCLDEAKACFAAIAREVARREDLLVVTPEPRTVADELRAAGITAKSAAEVREGVFAVRSAGGFRITIFECPTDDTWARDHAFLTCEDCSGGLALHDFRFNGWGGKFAAEKDDRINAALYAGAIDRGSAVYVDDNDTILEGGSVESDGRGTLLTTSSCLLSEGRNDYAEADEADDMLRRKLGAERVLRLDHGYLAGDDTDGHIDTLARLCPDDTIVYVRCDDSTDEHHAELKAMERELRAFRTADGRPYRLLPLPMADEVRCDGERLPATYANFLVMNGAVLMPSYGQPDNDRRAAEVLAEAFPDREIVSVDCRVLIRWHGSLHCVTMQYPEGVRLADGNEIGE